MIISIDGKVKISGFEPEVLTDLTCIIRAVHEVLTEKHDDEHANVMIAQAGKLAMMSTDEVKQATMDLLEEFTNKIE